VHAGHAGRVPEDSVMGRATRRSRSRIDSVIATSTPYKTSTTKTATVVAVAKTNSLRRNRASRRNSAMSTRRIAA